MTDETTMQQLNWMKINWNASEIESKGVIAGDEFISKSWKINASKIFLIMWFGFDKKRIFTVSDRSVMIMKKF